MESEAIKYSPDKHIIFDVASTAFEFEDNLIKIEVLSNRKDTASVYTKICDTRNTASLCCKIITYILPTIQISSCKYAREF